MKPSQGKNAQGKQVQGKQAIAIAAWGLLAACVLFPLGIAVANPLQATRDALWILGGLSGVVALALLLAQPLLAGGYLPGASMMASRRWHRWFGVIITATVCLHVAGLYLSSPADITDALLLVAPTPFSVYGVIGLVSVLLTAALVAIKSKSGLRYASWRIVHNALALVVVVASIVHALLIDGAMGNLSKAALCALILGATIIVLFRIHVAKAALKGR